MDYYFSLTICARKPMNIARSLLNLREKRSLWLYLWVNMRRNCELSCCHVSNLRSLTAHGLMRLLLKSSQHTGTNHKDNIIFIQLVPAHWCVEVYEYC